MVASELRVSLNLLGDHFQVAPHYDDNGRTALYSYSADGFSPSEGLMDRIIGHWDDEGLLVLHEEAVHELTCENLDEFKAIVEKITSTLRYPPWRNRKNA